MKSQNEYVNKMKTKLDQLDARIALWKAKADEAQADANIENKKVLADLKEQRKEAKEWLDKVSDASEDAWDSLKDGFENAYEKIKRAF